MIQIGKHINLYTEKVMRNVTYNTIISMNSTSYTFTPGSDVRFLAFSTILGSTEFTNMATVYDNYRILKVSFTTVNLSQNVVAPILYVDVSPSETPANPNNTQIIQDDSSKLFNPRATIIEAVTWNLKGVGTSTNIWLDTAIPAALGSINIGNQLLSNVAVIWDCKIDLVLEFANPK
jgi:hypothetical protein